LGIHRVGLWKFLLSKYDSNAAQDLHFWFAEQPKRAAPHPKEAQLSVGTTWQENQAFGRLSGEGTLKTEIPPKTEIPLKIRLQLSR
jgi:hypothetical protein